MMDWIDDILVPRIQQRAAGSPVVLILDKFSCHHTDAVKNQMEELGVILKAIPAYCTWLVQPINVCIVKPFKDTVEDEQWDWMHRRALDYDTMEAPKRANIEEWVVNLWTVTTEKTVRNSQRKTEFSYFQI